MSETPIDPPPVEEIPLEEQQEPWAKGGADNGTDETVDTEPELRVAW